MIGPNKNYTFYGHSDYSSGAGLNSVKISNKGRRFVKFRDGTLYTNTYHSELYSNSFFGTIKHESTGEMIFKDLTNGFECSIKFGTVKKKPSDHFAGEIKLKGITVCKVYGSYLSFVEFNDVRYWDVRDNIPVKRYEVYNQLKSSSLFREDRVLLEKRQNEEAQAAKEKLENIQRADRKLREKFSKLTKK